VAGSTSSSGSLQGSAFVTPGTPLAVHSSPGKSSVHSSLSGSSPLSASKAVGQRSTSATAAGSSSDDAFTVTGMLQHETSLNSYNSILARCARCAVQLLALFFTVNTHCL
jgi:hypothetical protein